MIKLRLSADFIDSHYDEVSKLITKRIGQVLSQGYISKKNKPNIVVSIPMRKFLTNLVAGKFLRLLITANPDKLERLITCYVKKWPRITYKDSDEYNILYNIFVSHTYEKLSKSNFITGVGTDTCSYCNRSYIYVLRGTAREIKSEIDHFYPKNRHPLLAASIYNLVPSCETCNSNNCKGKTDPHIVSLQSPYSITGNEFLFSYRLIKIDKRSPIYGSKVQVVLKKKIQRNSDLFGLEEFYKKHDDHVVELLIKSKLKYSNRYKKFLFSLLGYRFSDKDLNRMIVGNYTSLDELHRRPLSKMYRDIAIELELIKK